MQTDLLAPLPAPALTRLLSGVLNTPPLAAVPALHDVLGQWVDWTRAVSLSRVLDAPNKVEAGIAVWRRDDLVATCQRSRQRLHALALDEAAWQHIQHALEFEADTEAACQPLRKHWQDVQRKLFATTGQLRGQLRDLLLQGSAHQIRLAELDAVMEVVLSGRELSFFAVIPDVLQKRFAVLHAQRRNQREQVQGDILNATSEAELALRSFQNELRGLMQAEIDARFLPVDGLLAALKPH